MHVSSFYVAIHTGTDYPLEVYDEEAGKLVAMLVSVLSDTKVLDQLTHDSPLQTTMIEVEVGLEGDEDRELVGKAVLDMMGPEKVKLDKSRLSKIMKARPEANQWPQMKVLKKTVPREG